jgi:putative solute:sodium symporter small subunit
MKAEQQAAYWKENLTYIVVLLAIWFSVSYLAGIAFADQLDAAVHLGGFPLGFWFANQGSEVIFVVLIFVYVMLMNRLDKKYGVFEA